MKTVVIYTTNKTSYAIEKDLYEKKKGHLHTFEIDVPDDFIISKTGKKMKLKDYIETVDDVQDWLKKELENIIK